MRKFALICLLAGVLLLTGCSAKQTKPLRELTFFGAELSMDLETVTRLETQNGFTPQPDNPWYFTDGKQLHKYYGTSETGVNSIQYAPLMEVSVEELVAELGPYDQHGTERALNVYFWFGTMNGKKCTIRFDDYPYENLRGISLYVDEDQDGFSD